jgi:hypothetical protein
MLSSSDGLYRSLGPSDTADAIKPTPVLSNACGVDRKLTQAALSSSLEGSFGFRIS